MTKIKLIEHDGYVYQATLTKGGRSARVWQRDSRWYFEPHNTSDLYYVGRWMNWRLNRARRKFIRAGYWVSLPKAQVL